MQINAIANCNQTGWPHLIEKVCILSIHGNSSVFRYFLNLPTLCPFSEQNKSTIEVSYRRGVTGCDRCYFPILLLRCWGTLVTTMPGRKSRAAFKRRAV